MISEPDKGIYDGMNKGLRLATGDVVGILNADDFYSSADTLQKVAQVFEDQRIDSCYGDLVYVADKKESLQLAEPGFRRELSVGRKRSRQERGGF